MKLKNKPIFFIISAVLILGIILLLGMQAIKHEVLTRQYQNQQLSETRLNQINLLIKNQLEQKASHFSAIATFLPPHGQNMELMINNEEDLKNLFIMSEDNILYPTLNMDEFLSENKSYQWYSLVRSIYDDPSLLFSHYLDREDANPQSGWYSSYDQNGPILIFWVKQQDYIIGFQLSYVKVILDLIANLDDQHLTGYFKIFDNGQVIYDNIYQDNFVDVEKVNSLSQTVDYPFSHWQIDYYYSLPSNSLFYLFSVTLLFIIMGFIALLIMMAYREYHRTLRLAKQQVNFVGQVSHEFKTPLTNITLYSEMLIERLEDEPQPIPDYLAVIKQESQRLTRLIQNVLNFTKSAKVSFKSFNLEDSLSKVCHIFVPVFNKKAMILNFSSQLTHPTIVSDEDSIVQIVNNLLSNAEKYANHGKQVDLTLTQDENNVYIVVRDYGNGIATKQLAMIFKPFYRINSSLTEGVAGTGIGLTIAKQLAEQLQGDITVKNRKPGVEFILTIPNYSTKKES